MNGIAIDYIAIAHEKASSTAGQTYALLEVARQIQLLREYLIAQDKKFEGGKGEDK